MVEEKSPLTPQMQCCPIGQKVILEYSSDSELDQPVPQQPSKLQERVILKPMPRLPAEDASGALSTNSEQPSLAVDEASIPAKAPSSEAMRARKQIQGGVATPSSTMPTKTIISPSSISQRRTTQPAPVAKSSTPLPNKEPEKQKFNYAKIVENLELLDGHGVI